MTGRLWVSEIREVAMAVTTVAAFDNFDITIGKLNDAIQRNVNKLAMYSSAIVVCPAFLSLMWSVYREKRFIDSTSEKILYLVDVCDKNTDNLERIKSIAVGFDKSSVSMDNIMKKWNNDVLSVKIASLFPLTILTLRISGMMEDIIETSEDTADTLALSINDDFLNLVLKEIDGLSKN